MFDVFKKYIIKNDQKLLSVLDDMKLFKIKQLNSKGYGDEYEDEDYIDKYEKFYKYFQLPHHVTGIELRDTFMLIVDKYRNQEGINSDRYVYIMSKLSITSKGIFFVNRIGINLFSILMGIEMDDDFIKEEKSRFFENIEDMNDHQLEILYNISLTGGKHYILYQLQLFKDVDVVMNDNFTIINKKKSKRINIEDRIINDKDYYKNTTIPQLKEIILNVFGYASYIQNEEIVNVCKSKGSKKNVYIVRPKL